MIFERADGSFCRICSMFFGRDTLEGDLVAKEGILEILGTFIVKNVQVYGMALETDSFVD